MGNFEFNGKSTKDLGLVIQTPPTYNFPERDLSMVHVPGRNGDLIIDNNCYKNVERSYTIGKGFKPNTNYSANSADLLSWLTSANGQYVRLTDTYDPDVYRMAMFNMAGSTTNIWDEALSCTISFKCKPQRYLLSGENLYTYDPNLMVENPTTYTSLPDITLHNVGSAGELGKILMLSILNENEVVSNLTISYYTGNDITVSSEKQTAVDENQNNVGEYVGLNGKPFPQFKAGMTSIELKRYNIESIDIPSYDSVIKQTQTIVISEYKPLAEAETDNQERYRIPSYDELIEDAQEVYGAESVQSMILDQCEEYTFTSFNDILLQYGAVNSVSGNLSENEGLLPDWLIMEQPGGDGTPITFKLGQEWDEDTNQYKDLQAGFFFIKNHDKKIKLVKRSTGGVIIDKVSPSTMLTIYYYKAIVKNNRFELQATYADIPDWLSFVVDYDSNGCPITIHYKVKQVGYFWTDKTWIFGKAQWGYQNQIGTTLNSLQWKSDKQGFIPTEGTNISTSVAFTYKYIETVPQYKPITITEDKNGRQITKVIADVHFTVVDFSAKKDLSQIVVRPNDTGYYKYEIGDKVSSGWAFRTPTDVIIDGTKLKGTQSFKIYYLEASSVNDVPDFSKVKEWPTWLSRTPVKTYDDPNNPNPMMPKTVAVRVLEDGNYRHTEVDDEGNESYTNWVTLHANDPYVLAAKPSMDYSICQISNTLPSAFISDRCFTNEAKQSSQNPQIPLDYEIFIEIILKKDEDNKIECIRDYTKDETGYYAYTYTDSDQNLQIIYIKDQWNPEIGEPIYKKQSTETFNEIGEVSRDPQIRYYAKLNDSGVMGYYKWDNNTKWIRPTDDTKMLLVSSALEDTTFYYLASLPGYKDYDNFIVTVKVDYTGNPTHLLITVKEGVRGYFRCNNNSDWTYFIEREELISPKVGESSIIRYLEPENADLSNVTITYIPRWWML